MRYSASEKFEIIELVEQSSLSIPRTLAPIGIPRSTFYDWYSRYQEGGIEALEDGRPRPRRIWNKLPDKIETAIVNLALEEPDLSPRELAVNFTDTKGSFVSEATVYRLLKDHGLITSPAFILMKAADRFANPTTAPNQLWQTDFTYLKVIGWGWFYLSTVLDDFSRYILAWKLCTTMSATDVSDTLQVALQGSGLNQVKVLHRPRLLSDNGPSYVSSELGEWLEDNGIRHIRGRPYHPMTQGKIERYHRSHLNRTIPYRTEIQVYSVRKRAAATGLMSAGMARLRWANWAAPSLTPSSRDTARQGCRGSSLRACSHSASAVMVAPLP